MITNEPLSSTDILVKFDQNITPAEIKKFTEKIVHSPYATVIIDLSELYHLNFNILGKLHMLKLDLSLRSKRLVFQGCSEKLLAMLKLLKFDKTIEILRLSPQKQQTKKEPPKGDEKVFPF